MIPKEKLSVCLLALLPFAAGAGVEAGLRRWGRAYDAFPPAPAVERAPAVPCDTVIAVAGSCVETT